MTTKKKPQDLERVTVEKIRIRDKTLRDVNWQSQLFLI